MGLFDFILGKGKKVAEPAAPQAHQVSPEEFQKLRNAKRAEALVKEVEALELGIEELKVEVDGAQAIVFGKAPTQAAREKAVLAIGNTDIIQKVDDRMEVVAVEAATRATGRSARLKLDYRMSSSLNLLDTFRKRSMNNHAESGAATAPVLAAAARPAASAWAATTTPAKATGPRSCARTAKPRPTCPRPAAIRVCAT